jgi:hypothetical protein
MNRSMGSVRRSLIALVMIVASLAGAFDGCLLDCHPQSPAVDARAHTHCHPVPANQSAVRWQADSTCHHNHTAAAAESAVPTRLDSRPLGIVPSPQTFAIGCLTQSPSRATPSTAARSGPTVALVPLRV